MNLYGLFILGVNIKYIVFSILYRHINVPMALKELINKVNSMVEILKIIGRLTVFVCGITTNATENLITQLGISERNGYTV